MSIDVCKDLRNVYNDNLIGPVNKGIKVIPKGINTLVSSLGAATNSVVDALNMFTEYISNTVNQIVSVLNMFFPKLGDIFNIFIAYTSPVGFISLSKLYLIPFIEKALPGIEFSKAFQLAGMMLLMPLIGMAYLFYEGLFSTINDLLNKTIDKN